MCISPRKLIHAYLYSLPRARFENPLVVVRRLLVQQEVMRESRRWHLKIRTEADVTASDFSTNLSKRSKLFQHEAMNKEHTTL